MVWASIRNTCVILFKLSQCQIITIYLNENKNYEQKTAVTVEPGTASTYAVRYK